MRRSGRERKPTARVKESSDNLDPLSTKRIVKENLSNEKKMHFILYPVEPVPPVLVPPTNAQPATPRTKKNASTLGKRKRNSTPNKQRQPKKQKYPMEIVEPVDEEFKLPKEQSDEELSGVSEDGESLSDDDDDDEIKITRKNKNKRLTKRQKAMNTKVVVTDGLLSLPMDTTEKRPMTEEEQNKKSEQARRRKRLEERRTEEEKVIVIFPLAKHQF